MEPLAATPAASAFAHRALVADLVAVARELLAATPAAKAFVPSSPLLLLYITRFVSEPLAHTVLCFIVILCACKQESEHLLYTWFLRTDVALDIQLESLAALDDAA